MAFPATPQAVRQSLARMLAMPPLCFLSDDGRSTAELVLAEVLNNVAEHAYRNGHGSVSVSVGRTAQGVQCMIVDQGREMPGGTLPEGCPPALPDTALDHLPEGGFGWHLIRSLTSELSYARIDGCNHLRFVLP
ncbi:MAG: ATP-binding protein [Acetobacteraceae bacterium]|nr:MAG: ATP-binding protein [Acetobacteraceae bacterium]